MIPFWRTQGPTFWDTLYLNGELVAGICALTVGLGRAIQTDKSKEENGNSQTDNGYEGASVNGVVRLHTPEDLALFEKQIRQWSVVRGASDPIEIFHPQTLIAEIDVIRFKRWDLPPPNVASWDVTFQAVQWFDEKEATKPITPGAPGGEPPPPGSFDVPEPDPANLGANLP